MLNTNIYASSSIYSLLPLPHFLSACLLIADDDFILIITPHSPLRDDGSRGRLSLYGYLLLATLTCSNSAIALVTSSLLLRRIVMSIIFDIIGFSIGLSPLFPGLFAISLRRRFPQRIGLLTACFSSLQCCRHYYYHCSMMQSHFIIAPVCMMLYSSPYRSATGLLLSAITAKLRRRLSDCCLPGFLPYTLMPQWPATSYQIYRRRPHYAARRCMSLSTGIYTAKWRSPRQLFTARSCLQSMRCRLL